MNQKIDTQQIFGFVMALAFWWLLLGSVQVAVGVIFLVFIHEMGHFIAAKSRGIPVSLPTFTPVGAYVQMGRSSSITDEAYVKLAGPLVGGLAAVVSIALGHLLGSALIVEIGIIGVLLNLFNLIPLDPFDGGGIAQVLGRWTVVPGVLAFAYFFFMVAGNNTMNLLFGAYYAYIAWQAYQNRSVQWQSQPRYFRSSAAAKTTTVLAYLAVGGGLAWVFLNPAFIPSLLTSVGL